MKSATLRFATVCRCAARAACPTFALFLLTNGAFAAAPTIETFAASSITTPLGASVTLTWYVGGATALSLDQGIGPVTNTDPVGRPNVFAWTTVTPPSAGSHSYTLTATNADGTTTRDVVVTVTAPTETSPTRLAVESHWIGNTGARPNFPADTSLAGLKAWNGNVQNFLTDIGVFEDPNIRGGIPIVYTLSYYDETGLGNYLPNPNADQAGKSLDATYYDGIRLGKGFSSTPAERVNSLAATSSSGLVAHIENFYGRFFNFDGIKNAPPPTYPADPSGPYVSLSDGRIITLVEDPTAVDFDLSGRLWIADNGPDQNLKIFDVSGSGTPTLVATFGEPGGVFAGPIPGRTGDFRFWGIRGIAHDSAGRIYVGCTGLPMQTIGGTDIRMYSPDGSTLIWQVYGTFMHTADADPDSAGTSLFLNGKHFTTDYARAPGRSSHFTGVTLDPFRFPHDPRTTRQYETPWVRRIAGQKFLYLGNMYGGEIAIMRFESGSEFAVPAAFLSLISKNLAPDDVSPLHPVWADNESNKRNRWWWRDGDGDADFQAAEFGLWENWSGTAQGIDVDDAGGIWYGGRGKPNAYFRGGGLQYWPCTGVDAHGVPIYDFAHPQRPGVPSSVTESDVNRMRYLADSDTMFLGTSNDYYVRYIYRYDHFLDPDRQTLACRIDLGVNDLGVGHIYLDGNAFGMTLPMTFTADEDFIYVAYLTQGKEGRKRGEITVYDARDGHQVGWIVPGDEVGGYCGAIDLINGINVTTDASGHKLIMLEENGAGKVMVYRWLPPQSADTFASWRRANFAGPGQSDDATSGPEADPEAAGVTNLQRYAFGLAAHGPVAPPATVGTSSENGERHLTIAFQRRANGEGLSYVVEASSDLQTWDPIATYEPDEQVAVTATDSVAMSSVGTPRRFLRVRVQLAP